MLQINYSFFQCLSEPRHQIPSFLCNIVQREAQGGKQPESRVLFSLALPRCRQMPTFCLIKSNLRSDGKKANSTLSSGKPGKQDLGIFNWGLQNTKNWSWHKVLSIISLHGKHLLKNIWLIQAYHQRASESQQSCGVCPWATASETGFSRQMCVQAAEIQLFCPRFLTSGWLFLSFSSSRSSYFQAAGLL